MCCHCVQQRKYSAIADTLRGCAPAICIAPAISGVPAVCHVDRLLMSCWRNVTAELWRVEVERDVGNQFKCCP
jgi:hypothetical protein